MSFALVIYAQYLFALPVVLHGYIDRDECERAATAISDPVKHFCIPERHSTEVGQ